MKLFGVAAVILSLTALLWVGPSVLGPMTREGCVQSSANAGTRAAAVAILSICRDRFPADVR
jgi:hypothetical protein